MIDRNIIAYPVREFPRASDLSITVEIMLVPICCALYVIYEPRKTWLARIRHLTVWTIGITVIDFVIARYTKLQDHNGFD